MVPNSTQPLVSLAALERALSAQRLRAYSLPADRDETDGVARYLWNVALVCAIQPVLQALEVTFRNEISRVAGKLTAGRRFSYDRIPSWLDARPTMLLDHEARKVENAKKQLGTDARSQTEGHLVAKLDFGFWVALCRETYADWRGDGPRLWPRALDLAFRMRPGSVRTQRDVHQRFDLIRQYRNRVAHHEPIWDRDYLGMHECVVESLAWMSPGMARGARVMSPAVSVFNGGPGGFRADAEMLLGSGPGRMESLDRQLQSLSPDKRALVASLVDQLAAAPEEGPRKIAVTWAMAVPEPVE